MNKRKQEELRRQQEIERKKKKFRIVVFPSVSVVAVVLLLSTGMIPLHLQSSNSGFKPPSEMPWGKFVQVSDRNFGTSVKIYYISWYGCPIGATDSWAFYLALEHEGNASLTYPVAHYSSQTDIYPNTPGLIFYHSVFFQNVSFIPLYLYNQTMTGTIKNQPIQGNLLSYGLSALQSSLPSSVYALEYDIMKTVPTQGFNGQASGIANGHVNTNVIITGPKGAWALDGPLFNPSELKGLSSTQLLNGGAVNNTYIFNAETAVLNAMEAAQ